MEQSLLKSRIRKIGDGSRAGKCVLYVMSRDQRVKDNHALLAAQKHALAKQLPLAVVFCLQPSSGHRAREHYDFMLDGLRSVEAELLPLNIPFMMLVGDPLQRLMGMFHHVQPDAAYFDFNPLHGPLKLHEELSKIATFPIYEVDTHNIVPVWLVSDKQEVGARTLRPKIHRLLSDYLVAAGPLQKHAYPWNGTVMKLDQLVSHITKILEDLPSNNQKYSFVSGEQAAASMLNEFIKERLKNYEEDRNDPTIDGLSGLSPYLHFGQLSSLRVVLEITAAVAENPTLQPGADRLIEEMVVRKELSDNFCFYNKNYDKLIGAPQWAQLTLAKHATDQRSFLYHIEQWKKAATHDPAWNAAQQQMVETGRMHGYMRMYWAKKVLEWSKSPEEALKILIYLNDFYSIDGGDPNGYVGILWSVAGVHDRPWGERPVYGVIRSMVYTGLKRKFDISAYEKAWLR